MGWGWRSAEGGGASQVGVDSTRVAVAAALASSSFRGPTSGGAETEGPGARCDSFGVAGAGWLGDSSAWARGGPGVAVRSGLSCCEVLGIDGVPEADEVLELPPMRRRYLLIQS